MRIRQDAAAASLIAIMLAAPAAAQTTAANGAPLQLGQVTAKQTGATPAAEPSQPTAQTHKHPVARRTHHSARGETTNGSAATPSAAPEPARAPAAQAAVLPRTATPSPAPPLGPSPFIDAQTASWPPPAAASAGDEADVKVVPADQVNEIDLAADASDELTAPDQAGPAAQTDARGASDTPSSQTSIDESVAQAPAGPDMPWWPALLLSVGSGLLLGYVGWRLLARRRHRLPA